MLLQFLKLYVFLLSVSFGLQVGVSIQPADQTPPIQSDKYQCRIDTAIFLLLMGTWMPEHM